MSRPAWAAGITLIALLTVALYSDWKTDASAMPQAAQPAEILVFRNATLYTGMDEAPIKNGVLIVKAGKIVYAGTDAGKPDPELLPTETRDLKGAVIIPGLVDTHSHIGLWARPGSAATMDGNEASGPVQPGIRAVDAINPDDPGIRMATAGGVTTANIMPGSGNVIGGQTLYVKLRGRTVDEMRLIGLLPDGTKVLGGLKMANGENPKNYGKTKQQAPFTRMKVAALQREQFVKAREYKAKLDAKQPVERDISLEPIVEVLERKRTIHFHCHRADDIMTAVRIAEEFNCEIVLQHCTEGYRVADILAKKKIPASLTLIDSPGGKAETIGLLEENAFILEKAGMPVAINTDDGITESRFLLRTAAIAVRGGMSESAAIKALTLVPAKMMHLDHRLGSLEKGKDADFVILSGSPFSNYTQVLETYIDGKKVFDRAKKSDWAYQVGGFMLPDGQKDLPAPYPPAMAPKSVPVPAVVLSKTAGPPPKKTVIVAGRIHTAIGPPIVNGVIVVESGTITGVFDGKDFVLPADATVLTAAEVSPGFIDAFCMAGLTGAWNIPADQDQDELSDPNQADLRVIDGFNPNEPLLEFLHANGVTVIHSTPGRANVIAGQSAICRTDGGTLDRVLVRAPGAILINLGESPKEAYKGKAPTTRMGTTGIVRKAFAEAQSYKAKQGANTPRSPKLEALIPALEGKVPVYFAAHRADDIVTALRIAEEFALKPVIVLGTEAYRLADELKKAGIPVVVHPTMQRAASSQETQNGFIGNAAVLADKGVPVCISTAFESYVPKTRVLRYEASVAAANGLGHDRALRAITIEPAKLLGIADKYGSIEKGKVADLVLYDGDPFETTTHVTHTLMAGRVVYSRDEYVKLPFERRILPLLAGGREAGCCLSGW